MEMDVLDPKFWDESVREGAMGEKDILNTDEEWDKLVNIFDFPMESLEDGDNGVEWDFSKSDCLGPIPPDTFVGLPSVPTALFSNTMLPLEPSVPIGGTVANQSDLFQAQSPVSVLESSISCSGGKSLPIKTDIKVPARTRSKRARRTSLNPWFVMWPIFSASSTSNKTLSSRKNNNRKKKLSPLPLPVKITGDSFKQAEELLDALESTKSKETSLQRSIPIKKCSHCEVTKTPQWREGPNGPKTLCNACGVRYRSGRLFPEYRPAASPTFVPSLHSNSHKKVVEMRKRALPEISDCHDPAISPPPDFVPINSTVYDFLY